METAERSESGAGECARCRRLLPAAPGGQTRRGDADSGSINFWRPWVDRQSKKEQESPHYAEEAMSDSPGKIEAWGKLSQYRHPVRLFWPKSKCYDYLYQEAEALLKKFPIQATISFYEDSDSEDEIEELTCDSEN
ncbi:protein ripply2 [Choloepus didactylus]|uniref:protein ripply2 n=1 Tax=Choloepus didactylus TaxID=27675 RepID=UPI00189E8F62|nr:protein ripply2 [Choloepus didactylus]